MRLSCVRYFELRIGSTSELKHPTLSENDGAAEKVATDCILRALDGPKSAYFLAFSAPNEPRWAHCRVAVLAAQSKRQALGIDAAYLAKAGGDEGDHAVIGGIEVRGLALAPGEAIDAASLGQGKRQRA